MAVLLEAKVEKHFLSGGILFRFFQFVKKHNGDNV